MNKKKEEPDYEKMYYELKREISTLKKDLNISIEFTSSEIDLLTKIMYEELHNLKDRTFFNEDQDDDDEDPMKRVKPKKDVLLYTMIEEQKTLLENITRKLRLEV